MKLLSVIVVCVFVLFVSTLLTPQDNQQFRVGFVNVHTCFNEYQKAKEIIAEMKDRYEQLKQELQNLKKQIEVQSELFKNAQTEKVREDAFLQSQQFKALYEAKLEFFKSRYSQGVNDAHIKVYSDIMAAVDIYARQNNLDLVLKVESPLLSEIDSEIPAPTGIRYRSALYWRKENDITKQIIEILNSQYQREKSTGSSEIRELVKKWEKEEAAIQPQLPEKIELPDKLEQPPKK